MYYSLVGKTISLSLNDAGQVVSFKNRLTDHEYIDQPGQIWKMIYQDGERTEIPVFSTGQLFTAKFATVGSDEQLLLHYDNLKGCDRVFDTRLTVTLHMGEAGLGVTTTLEHRDTAELMEIQVTLVSGAHSLSGCPERDAIAWPVDLGRIINNPAESDLSVYAGYRKYERRDQDHTDLNGLYPGLLSMQWTDWFNEQEGLYVGSHDPSHQTTGLHVERDVKTQTLSLGVIRYPMLKQNESWLSAPIVYAVHQGDWHAGSRIYRTWIESAGWTPPQRPDWVQNSKGWLRVILKQQHGEINWAYDQIPQLYMEAADAGFDTIYLLGFEKGGFARHSPDYLADPRLGGEDGLREAIKVVQGMNGRVLLYISYSMIDPNSEYYRSGPGRRATVKSFWGSEVPFPETYCGEGTWRKLGNPPMPMYFSCPGSPEWQEKMLETIDYCLGLGADGILFDLGGKTPFFCYDPTHTHTKPSLSCSEKANRYRALRDAIRSFGPDRTIMMEHSVDIFAQHMDLSQGASTKPDPKHLLALYRYTFPELVMTNRECAMDEVNYRLNANTSFVYGLRFDMSVYRCCGTLSDMPNYAAYVTHLNQLRDRYADFLLRGMFIDTDGFALDNARLTGKAYRSSDGRIGVALHNPTQHSQAATLQSSGGKRYAVSVDAESVAVVILD